MRSIAGRVSSEQLEALKGNRAMAGKTLVEFTRGRLLSSTQEADEPVFEPGRRKPPQRVTIAPEDKILVSREEAAQLLSISQRGLDYLVASKRLPTRRIGGRVLIPVAELRKYARCDHPERIVS
jgi:excisionase family DNA binding protein